jgi:hypothetical protein
MNDIERIRTYNDAYQAMSLAAHEAGLAAVEAAVRKQIARDIEANAAGIAKAAEGWRTSERHPVNSSAAAQYDRVNAEVREAMAKHLRTVVVPMVRGESRD